MQASCRWDIERGIPSDQFPEVNAEQLARLEERTAARAAVTGDLDAILPSDVAAAEWNAVKAFAATRRTTLPGLLAMIEYARQIEQADPDAFTDHSPLLNTMAAAARALARSGTA